MRTKTTTVNNENEKTATNKRRGMAMLEMVEC
jgi:hypothetical protein